MKHLFISCLLMLSTSFAYADELDLQARMAWPSEYNNVGQVAVYFIEPTGYQLFLNDHASEIAALKTATIQDQSIKSIREILLDIVPDDYLLVVDQELKLISFAAE